MKSVVALAMGGLGNQLFIYAFNRSLALRSCRKLSIDSNWGFSNDVYKRSYRLHHFPGISEASTELSSREKLAILPAYSRLLRGLVRLLPPAIRPYLDETYVGASYIPRKIRHWIPTVATKGYWQDEKYFEDHADLIRAELKPPFPETSAAIDLGERINGNPYAVFLHVRRINYPELLDKTYYDRAITEKLRELKDAEFFVFGDDPNWAIENLNFQESSVSVVSDSGWDELVDLWLMTNFRHAIIANSTFSWWGAWLADASTVAPRFTYPHSCVIPKRWKVI